MKRTLAYGQGIAELPTNLTLEGLRKEALGLLRAYRKSDPVAIEQFRTLKARMPPSLEDARRLIAAKYGFRTWKRLNDKALLLITERAFRLAWKAVKDDDVAGFSQTLEEYPTVRSRIDDPVWDFNSPLINHVRSTEMLDELLNAGADINGRSRWAAGSFGLLDTGPPEVAKYAIDRGAAITVHAAARLGLLDKLKELIASDPPLVHARGGDGQTPLHFASTVEIAEYLLDHGADIDARDLDHESTAAQWMIRLRPEVAGFLVGRGCKTDILMAAALGDVGLLKKHLRDDPESIRIRVSHEYFPLIDSGRAGGTIYQWQFGWFVSAVQVAKSFGHQEVFDFLIENSPPDEKLLNACWLHDAALVQSLLAQQPDLVSRLPPAGRRHLAHAVRNNDSAAARLFLMASLPIDGVSQHNGTVLHWAAWHGNTELIHLLLDRNPPLEIRDRDFDATPLDWAIHASLHGWHPGEGDYPGTVEALLNAGAEFHDRPNGSGDVQAVLARHRAK